MQDDPAEDSHRPFGSRCVAGPQHDGEHVLFGLIVELQGPDHREAAPAIVVAAEDTGLLFVARASGRQWDRGRS